MLLTFGDTNISLRHIFVTKQRRRTIMFDPVSQAKSRIARDGQTHKRVQARTHTEAPTPTSSLSLQRSTRGDLMNEG